MAGPARVAANDPTGITTVPEIGFSPSAQSPPASFSLTQNSQGIALTVPFGSSGRCLRRTTVIPARTLLLMKPEPL